jgi:general L-amino acid transport system substrate-binding protein
MLKPLLHRRELGSLTTARLKQCVIKELALNIRMRSRLRIKFSFSETRVPIAQILVSAFTLTALTVSAATASNRMEAIKVRGSLLCGVIQRVPGFTDIDTEGQVSGFEPDLCRAVAAAILGPDAGVTYVMTNDVQTFLTSDVPDVVARRLTVTMRRALTPGLVFSRVVFFDGAALLVPIDLQGGKPSDLSDLTICLQGQSETDRSVTSYFREKHLPVTVLRRTDIQSAADTFLNGDCGALAGDLSELAPIRARHPESLALLPELLSREPLALLTHAVDDQFSAVVDWTMNALIAAEELGITKNNVRTLREHPNPEARRLLGFDGGNGAALGLRESWAADVIATVGNYGEIYARHLGDESTINLPRGHNALWRDGGLLYPIPMR